MNVMNDWSRHSRKEGKEGEKNRSDPTPLWGGVRARHEIAQETQVVIFTGEHGRIPPSLILIHFFFFIDFLLGNNVRWTPKVIELACFL